jgi:hypothetical protein
MDADADFVDAMVEVPVAFARESGAGPGAAEGVVEV